MAVCSFEVTTSAGICYNENINSNREGELPGLVAYLVVSCGSGGSD